MRVRVPAAALVVLAIICTAAAVRGQDHIEQSHFVYVPLIEAPAYFQETFDLDPASPAPFSSPRWDIYVHERQAEHLYQLHPMLEAGHGPNCEPPPATHVATSYEEAVYLCRNHLMTTLDSADPGYSLIYLTPDKMADFAGQPAVISWDVSTLPGGPRDWWDVWISPYDDHLVAPLEEWLPDLNGPPRRAVHVKFSPVHYYLEATVYDSFTARSLPMSSGQGYHQLLMPSAMDRQTFQIRISQNRLQVGMPHLGLWWIDAPLALDWNEGVVQFGHHSYTPHKDNGRPNTWHWDNFIISPARPFDMIRATNRFADASQPQLSFGEPARAGSMLRFNGIGRIEASFDQGNSWSSAAPQLQRGNAEDKFRSYWMPIPQGTSSVSFRGVNPPYNGPWHVRNVSIWNRNP